MGNGPGDDRDRKRIIGEQIWLHYYNQALFERGAITEDERNRMAVRINARGGLSAGK